MKERLLRRNGQIGSILLGCRDVRSIYQMSGQTRGTYNRFNDTDLVPTADTPYANSLNRYLLLLECARKFRIYPSEFHLQFQFFSQESNLIHFFFYLSQTILVSESYYFLNLIPLIIYSHERMEEMHPNDSRNFVLRMGEYELVFLRLKYFIRRS